MISKQFSKNLSALLAQRQLSQNEAARLTGISQTYIGYLIRGEKVPTIDTIERLARGFRIHPWQLIAPTEMMDWDERIVELINAFNSASPESRQSILRIAKAETEANPRLRP